MTDINLTQNSATPAMVGGEGYGVKAVHFEFSKGSAPATGDVFQIWAVKKGTRILQVSAQAPDLADGAWSVGSGADTDRFLDVADASAAVTLIDGPEGMGYLFTADGTLDVVMGTLTTASDVTFKVTVLYTRDYETV